MALKQQVFDLHKEHPDWSARDIADTLKCEGAYVRETMRRASIKLPDGRLNRRPNRNRDELRARRELGEIALRSGVTAPQLRILLASFSEQRAA